MPIDFQSASFQKIAELDRSKTVFLFPVGPLECHGPHLPLGTDLYYAQKIAQLLGTRVESDLNGWKVVLMPTAPLGVETNTSKLGIKVRAHVLRDWLVDAIRSIQKEGFYFFACVTGHSGPRQLTAIEEAGKMVKSRMTLFRKTPAAKFASLHSGWVSFQDVLKSPFRLRPDEHAGNIETSQVLFADQTLVDPCFQTLPAQEPRKNHYWGNPSAASSEMGKKVFEEECEKIYPKFRSFLVGKSSKTIFRSWYSVFPPNWSFFKAWVLFAATMLLLLFWVSITLKSLGI